MRVFLLSKNEQKLFQVRGWNLILEINETNQHSSTVNAVTIWSVSNLYLQNE